MTDSHGKYTGMGAGGNLSATARRTVEKLLSAQFDAHVCITGVEDFPYSQVSRCALRTAGDTVPHSVIVRVLRGDPARSHSSRLHHEQAALEFLASISSDIVPRCIAIDVLAGILITEDLGAHPSLLDLLLGNDAPAAYGGIIDFARSLGMLHAQTVGYVSEYRDRRARLGSASSDSGHSCIRASLSYNWSCVQAAVNELGLPHSRGVDSDIDEIARILAEPGSWLTISSGDPSPGNCIVADNNVRFFDFEDACFRHALIDAVVLRYPYPTGGPVWRLPGAVTRAIEQAYRQEVVHAIPPALDDSVYESGMAAASAEWTIQRMSRLARVDAGPNRDEWPLLPRGWSGPIPMRSRRRQLVAIMETCIASAHRANTLGSFVGWLESMARVLRERWPEASEDILLYPAFSD